MEKSWSTGSRTTTQRIESFPVLSRVEPGDIRKRLPARPPQTGESFDAMMRDVEEIVLPGITHWQSPSFFAYFPELLGPVDSRRAAVGGPRGCRACCGPPAPPCTELETHVLDWLVDMLGLPERLPVSSERRRRDPGHRVERGPLRASRGARASDRSAASNRRGLRRQAGRLRLDRRRTRRWRRAAKVAGDRAGNLRVIEVDESFAMSAPALEARIDADRTAGLRLSS